ncbi:MAG TPA: trypsin-like serine protease [Rubricoccaceae bacterium]|nr:trypsin-like serine protease [Rubricoccaceae bacterium]
MRTSTLILSVMLSGVIVPAALNPPRAQPAGGRGEALTVATRDADTPMANATVRLSNGCTGVLIRPDIVLTAGHCLEPAPERTPGEWHSLAAVGVPRSVSFGVDRTAFRETIPATHYNPAGYDDIVLLALARPVAPSVAIPQPVLLRTPSPRPTAFWRGQRFVMAGWGGTETEAAPRFRLTANARDGVIPFVSFGVLQPHLMRVSGEGGATVIPGDSGSPLYWTNPATGARTVVGVAQGTEGGGGRYVVTFGQGGLDSDRREHPNIAAWLEAGLRVSACAQLRRQAQVGAPTRNLYNWWSSGRADHFATADPEWAGCDGERIVSPAGASYTFTRLEGLLFSPDHPQPEGTVRLSTWWHAARGDNFLTSLPDARPRDPLVGGRYAFVRHEGYLYAPDRPRPATPTVPLYSWFNATRGDYFTTTDPRWAGRPGDRREGYVFHRLEGYLLPSR